jgi:hypothetical protein
MSPSPIQHFTGYRVEVKISLQQAVEAQRAEPPRLPHFLENPLSEGG